MSTDRSWGAKWFTPDHQEKPSALAEESAAFWREAVERARQGTEREARKQEAYKHLAEEKERLLRQQQLDEERKARQEREKLIHQHHQHLAGALLGSKAQATNPQSFGGIPVQHLSEFVTHTKALVALEKYLSDRRSALSAEWVNNDAAPEHYSLTTEEIRALKDGISRLHRELVRVSFRI